MGILSWSTDGGGASTQDMYGSSATRDQRHLAVASVPEGRHVTTFTVGGKNASSSGYGAQIMRFVVGSTQPAPSVRYMTARAGETVSVPAYYRAARIARALSGTPTLGFFGPGSASISVTGGDAVVELSR